jgi:type I restriction enzyme S subunit
MDAQQFLAEFSHFAAVPGGVAQIRQMIYQLAVIGALTHQLETDGDASILLADIDHTRQRLVRDNKYKRLQKLESKAVEVPPNIKLPASWCWTRLLDVGQISPRNDASDGLEVAFVPMSGIPQLHRGRLLFESRKWGDIKNGFTHFANGDVVVAKITPCFENGKAAIISGLENLKGIGAGTTELHVFRPIHSGIISAYVYLFVRSPLFKTEGERNMIGTAGQKRLTTEYFATRAVPLPPIQEQYRIAAKVDDLMSLCDKLEIQQQQGQKLQRKSRQAVLKSVADSTTSLDLQAHWRRLSQNLNQLLDPSGDIKDIKGLILDLAVSGRLLNKKGRDMRTGGELLQSIAAARLAWSRSADGQELKEALAMVKKIRAQRAVEPDKALPMHWCWASLLQVSQAVVDCHNKTAPYVSHGIHLVRTTDIRNGRMDLSSTRKISETTYAYWARRMPPRPGDIVITREAPMGEAAIVPESEKVCLGQRTMMVRLFPELFNNRFLVYVIQSPSFQQRMLESAIGMTVKHLRIGGVEELMVPVPPKEEQDRIVEIVDHLLRYCDRLSDQLSRKHSLAGRLIISSIEALTGISIEREEREPLKPPHTELIALLLLGQAPDVKTAAPLAAILAHHNGEMGAKDLWQRFGGEIDAFYAQLKREVAQGWICEPEVAAMRERETV